VIFRAKEILFDLECGNTINMDVSRQSQKRPRAAEKAIMQLSLFDGVGHPAVEQLKKLNIDEITPMQALNILDKLIKECK
jgi:DNA mismatch repair protein MutS